MQWLGPAEQPASVAATAAHIGGLGFPGRSPVSQSPAQGHSFLQQGATTRTAAGTYSDEGPYTAGQGNSPYGYAPNMNAYPGALSGAGAPFAANRGVVGPARGDAGYYVGLGLGDNGTLRFKLIYSLRKQITNENYLLLSSKQTTDI